MYLLETLLAVSTIYGLAGATPISVDVTGKKTFTLEQVLSSNLTSKTPAQRMLSVYEKYSKIGASAPSAVKKAAVSATIATVAATPEPYDVSYLCPVTVGGKTLNLNFDTGSADLWVYSNLQPSTQQSGHTIYNTKSGVLKNGYTWNIQYGDGSGAGGKVYADKVVVGSVTATSQAVEAATSVSDSFLDDSANDGILGLAFSTLNTVSPSSQNTFFDTIKSQLSKPVFTANLMKGAAGTYDFGFIDTAKYSGSITYTNVNTANGFWQFTAGGYSIGTGSKVSKSYSAVADTGTSLLLLPSSIVSAYYKTVSEAVYNDDQGGWIFPCNAKLPSWSAVIGGNKFTVPGSYINYAQISNTQCFGGMQSDTGIGFSIFGDVFLKSQFVVFSQVGSQPQVGFAAKK